MAKAYSEFMDEITPDELYQALLAYGLFSEKLPPVFDATEFYDYSLSLPQPFSKYPHGYIYYEAMRDINIPRPLGIPHPMAYQCLCRLLADNWDKIRIHFHTQTDSNEFRVSRTHIQKMKESKSLFKMNYPNWKVDTSPVPDIQIGMKYVVRADISNCFPSMYTHALPWAIIGKDKAKTDKSRNRWYNELDHRCMELKSGETHGFLIGPHASNLLAEIILTVVDNRLTSSDKKWKFIRHIDDYECYVATYEDGQDFLTALGQELRYFDLSLNHKKTKIEELPVAATTHWVRQINAVEFLAPYGGVNYKTAQAYIDAAISLMETNGNNAAILNYAIKVLARQSLSKNAKELCLKTFLHLAFIYPYLIPLLDEYVFIPYDADMDVIQSFAQKIYENALTRNNFEAVSYAIYFALKYEFEIENLTSGVVIEKGNCMFSLMSLLYFRKNGKSGEETAMGNYALILLQTDSDFDQNWLFVYEALPYSKLKDEWKPMKRQGVSFIKKEFRG